MKKLFLFFLISFMTICYSDEPEHFGELIINVVNFDSEWEVTFMLTATSARWDGNYDLSEDYETASVNLKTYPTVAYFDHILYQNNYPVFAIGLYKISAFENGVEQAYFYMDWRTSYNVHSVDVSFYYDIGNNHFRNFENTIIDHSLQTLWDLTSNLLETSGLEDYWDNCLAVFNNGDDHPKFAWGPYPGFSNNYYKIYKKKGTPNFVLFDSTTSTTYVDVNEEILTGPPHANEGYIYYKITSVGFPVEIQIVILLNLITQIQ